MEGTACGPVAAECTDQTRANLVLPIEEYGRDQGSSVTGGYVYRGSLIPGLRGHYIYADYGSSMIVRLRVEGGEVAERVEITQQLVAPGSNNPVQAISSFGTDNGGEIYVAAYNAGAIYRIVQAP